MHFTLFLLNFFVFLGNEINTYRSELRAQCTVIVGIKPEDERVRL